MTADALAIAEFLLARIAEDEAAARAATPGPWRTFPDAEGGVWAREGYGMAATGCGEGNAEHIARHDPAHVLAVCAAHRHIVVVAQDVAVDQCADRHDKDGREILRALASIYAGREGWREEWS